MRATPLLAPPLPPAAGGAAHRTGGVAHLLSLQYATTCTITPRPLSLFHVLHLTRLTPHSTRCPHRRRANDFCQNAGRQTVSEDDIFSALRELEFDDMIDPLESFLQSYNAAAEAKKQGKRAREASRVLAEAAESETWGAGGDAPAPAAAAAAAVAVEEEEEEKEEKGLDAMQADPAPAAEAAPEPAAAADAPAAPAPAGDSAEPPAKRAKTDGGDE